MRRLGELKATKNLDDVARLLGFKPSAVSFILYKQPSATKYTTFEVPKKQGGTRTILAPRLGLKLLQKKLSDLLQDCLEEISAQKRRKDQIAHGFRRGRSISTNAERHRNRR